MALYPCAIGDPRGREAVRARSYEDRAITPDLRSCALRAPTAISARIKGIRPEIAVLVNGENVLGVWATSQRSDNGARESRKVSPTEASASGDFAEIPARPDRERATRTD